MNNSSSFNISLIVFCHFAFVWKAKVIPVYDGSSDLLSVLMEETGGLGVDIVVDSGGKLFSQITLLTRQNMMWGAVNIVMACFFLC